ncbi:MAG: class IV adenylate cyclase [Planctomycetia bacterium]
MIETVYEVEMKFPVADAQGLERRLLALGGRFDEPVDQVDRYFAHPARDFATTDEALRLRRVGDTVAITWKGPRVDATTKTRREIELPLAEPRRTGSPLIEQWTGLLEALGFRQVMEVAKRRRPVQVDWHGAGVDVALDAVVGLGDFVELEIQAGEGELPHARGLLESLARELGFTAQERRSYLELLLTRATDG